MRFLGLGNTNSMETKEITKKKELEMLFDHKDTCFFSEKCKKLGAMLFEFETQHGVPINYCFDWLKSKHDISKEEEVGIFYNYQNELIEHKIKSNITEKRLEDLRENNRKQLMNVIRNGIEFAI